VCEYHILYHHDKTLCVVTNSILATDLCFNLRDLTPEQVSAETIDQCDQDWVRQRSFIVLTSDVKLKQKTVEKLQSHGANFFSAVNKKNRLGSSTKIGVGTWIDCYNQSLALDTVVIKDHCIISSFNLLGHGLALEDFCHISAHGFFSNCTIGQGSVIGTRSTVIGDQQRINIAPYTNLLTGSTVTKNILVAGTYLGNRRFSNDTSLDQRIL
jgi:acetyltransferase-like isoleucine patch superfamily enzyme